MSTPTASFEVVNSGRTRFSNATPGDFAIFTNSTAQSLHLGTVLNSTSALYINGPDVNVPNNLNLMGTVTHNGTTIIDSAGKVIGSTPSLPLTGGAMTGQIQGFINDTNTSPAYTWSNDTTTGFYNKSAGVVGVVSQSVEVASFAPTGILTKGLRISN